MPSPNPEFASRVGQSGFFFISMKVSFVPKDLPLFDISLVTEKNPLSTTNVIINSDKALVNQCNEAIHLTSEPQTLEALENAFLLIFRFEMCLCYAYILFTQRSKYSEGCSFYVIFFFLISYCFHRFYCNQVTVNLDPTVALVWNGNIAEKSFVYFFQ